MSSQTKPLSQCAPIGWPLHLAWPPPDEVITAAQATMQGRSQMRLFGRPAFIIDGIALSLIVELTGHRGVCLEGLAQEAMQREQ